MFTADDCCVNEAALRDKRAAFASVFSVAATVSGLGFCFSC